MDLLLWRHADAFEAGAGEDDLERALTPKGLKQAARIARWLHSVLPADVRVIASPALRAQQTARAFGRVHETVEALAPNAFPQAVLQAADWPHARHPVLVVGHQPTLGLAASLVLCGHAQHWSVRKAAVWWLRAEGGGRVELVAMRAPEHEQSGPA